MATETSESTAGPAAQHAMGSGTPLTWNTGRIHHRSTPLVEALR
ncbi:hypothetical protein [Streptomyces sp. NPDC000878]